LIAGAVIVVVVLAWLLFQTIQSSSTYYVKVQDIRASGASQRLVRVSGHVVTGTVDWQATDLLLRFELQDETGQLPVSYHGVRPDMFQDGAQTVVEGRYLANGTLDASSLLLKCPSKYEEGS
jgi:cytochrome c-type biogenesis protein CcmE